MMGRRPDNDELMAQRYVDNALAGAELEAARARLDRDPAFRRLVEELEGVGRWFGAGDEGDLPTGAPAGFANRVAFAARTGGGVTGGVERLMEQLTWAAALLILLGVGAIAGLQVVRSGSTLSAEGDLEQRFEELLRDARRNESNRALLLNPERAEGTVPDGGVAPREK